MAFHLTDEKPLQEPMLTQFTDVHVVSDLNELKS